MIEFYYQQGAIFQMLFHHRGRDAKVGGNTDEGTVLSDGKSYRILGVM